MDKSTPFFFYGTLIPGQPNEFYWRGGASKIIDAVYPHGRLVSLSAFPMLLEDEPTPYGVKGVLIYLTPDYYAQVQLNIDRLEEHDPENPDAPYERVLRDVHTAEGPITAWVYVGSPDIGATYPTIESGDWVAYIESLGADSMTKWWREKGTNLLFGRGSDE